MDLAKKVFEVDLDNQRLQSEIESLQEKYNSIANGIIFEQFLIFHFMLYSKL